MAAVAEFDSVGLRYGTGAEVLRDLDFRLRTGSFYFLTGPSGAGKTSLLKLLYLAQRPTRGRIKIFGEELTEAPREELPPFRRPKPERPQLQEHLQGPHPPLLKPPTPRVRGRIHPSPCKPPWQN